ncbi:undecaprenyl-diphosphate phosphatase [Acidaminobacter sp. JC074]|uniref:undecaprenyl-diphosphate phosphatase n=1 Tax=Acidaminobacter sp. JC074 TaxID=2530199 RepID=UPI001F0DD625|nr:undecaprenyl-diphosphate phosphatase [Acidaminobacter sp. JC074]MCH4889158.1 undecaprenyl-diphosphate phosphatase [Acidaminobacter sp. JC074]
MEIIKVIILGIVEGLTEFLPVSSTGHLILVSRFMSLEGKFNDIFNIVIQSGAILAVIVYFWKKVFPPLPKKGDLDSADKLKRYINLWLKVIVAIIPAGVIGVLFEDKIEELLFNPLTVAIALIVGAVILLYIESKPKPEKVTHEDDITYKEAFIVGIFQCLALIPGMSRSASTIIGGLVMGFRRAVAAEFSFFMAIPVILGASLIKLLKAGFGFTSYEYLLLGIGTLVSFVVAYAVIAVFMNFIKKHDFKVFAYYRIILGIVVLISMFI